MSKWLLSLPVSLFALSAMVADAPAAPVTQPKPVVVSPAATPATVMQEAAPAHKAKAFKAKPKAKKAKKARRHA